MQRRLDYFKYANTRDFRSKRPYAEDLVLHNVSLNISLKAQGLGGDSLLLKSVLALESIARQKATLRRSRKPLPSAQLQKGAITGISVCLRGCRAHHFLEKFGSVLLPGLSNSDMASQTSFDKRGNMAFRFKTLLTLPEVEGEYQHFQPGKGAFGRSDRVYLPLSISFATSCRNRREGALFFSSWFIPSLLME